MRMRHRNFVIQPRIHNIRAVLHIKALQESKKFTMYSHSIRGFYWYTESLPYKLRDAVRELAEMYPGRV